MTFLKRTGLIAVMLLLLTGGTGHTTLHAAPANHHQVFEIEILVECVEEAIAAINGFSGQNTWANASFNEWGSSASFSRRVEPAAYARVKAALRGLGDVRHENERTSSLAAEVLDLQARIAASTTEIERLTTMMANSADLQVLIAVDGRLSQVMFRRDEYQGRLNAINSTTAMPLVNITVWDNPAALEPEPAILTFGERLSEQFVGSAISMMEFGADVLVFISHVIIPLALLVFVAGITLLIVRGVGRRKRLSKKEVKS